MLLRIEKLLFYLLLFSIPIQLGKHFWPQFSYVSGIRVDYLSPTLYFSDIIIVFLFLVFFLQILLKKKKISFKFSDTKFGVLVIFTFLSILISLFFVYSVQAVWYGIAKLIEFLFVGYYVATQFKKKQIPTFIDIISFGGIAVSILAIWQFIMQRSVGGLLYFVGERTFTSTTIGIAVTHINDAMMLRPYASFPHPNLLAYFLLFVIVFISLRFFVENSKSEKIFLMGVFLLTSSALLLTLSRVVLICYGIFFLYLILRILKRNLKYILLLAFPLGAIGFYLFFFSSRFVNSVLIGKDLSYRIELTQITAEIVKQYPLGVGLNNFFYHEITYQNTITPTLLQPVHNIYLVVLVQVGILGFVTFLWFLLKTWKRVWHSFKRTKVPQTKEFYRGVLIFFVVTVFIGLFDHFPLTLQQGQLIFILVLGCAWAKLRS